MRGEVAQASACVGFSIQPCGTDFAVEIGVLRPAVFEGCFFAVRPRDRLRAQVHFILDANAGPP